MLVSVPGRGAALVVCHDMWQLMAACNAACFWKSGPETVHANTDGLSSTCLTNGHTPPLVIACDAFNGTQASSAGMFSVAFRPLASMIIQTVRLH